MRQMHLQIVTACDATQARALFLFPMAARETALAPQPSVRASRPKLVADATVAHPSTTACSYCMEFGMCNPLGAYYAYVVVLRLAGF